MEDESRISTLQGGTSEKIQNKDENKFDKTKRVTRGIKLNIINDDCSDNGTESDSNSSESNFSEIGSSDSFSSGSCDPDYEEETNNSESGQRKHICSWKNCNKIFKQSKSLKYHMLVHNNLKPFKCSLCDQSFRTRVILNKHSMRMHDPLRPDFDCNQCTASFKTEAGLSNHHKANIHNHLLRKIIGKSGKKRIRACVWENCNRTFTDRQSFQYHMRVHKNEKPCKCPHCDKCFRVNRSLKKHIRRVHDPQRAVYECYQCKLQFKTQLGFRNHVAGHNMNIITMPRKLYSDSEKKFNCEVCNRKFLRIDSLRNHQKTHTEEKSYECSQCDSKFYVHYSLVRHSKIHDPSRTLGLQEIECESITQPSIGFNNSTDKIEMLQPKRENEKEKIEAMNVDKKPKSERFYSSFVIGKPETCIKEKTLTKEEAHITEQYKRNIFNNYSSDCNSSTSSSIDDNRIPSTIRDKLEIDYHEQISIETVHAEQSPEDCICDWKGCGRHFSDLSKMRSHREIHVNETIFQCSMCPLTFQHSANLLSHFKISHYLKKQENQNILSKPKINQPKDSLQEFRKWISNLENKVNEYSCNECGKTFSTSERLNFHKQLFHDSGLKKNYSDSEKQLSCDDCNKKFVHLSSLKIHRKVHTAENIYMCLQCNTKFDTKNNLIRHFQIHVRNELDTQVIETPSMNQYSTEETNTNEFEKQPVTNFKITPANIQSDSLDEIKIELDEIKVENIELVKIEVTEDTNIETNEIKIEETLSSAMPFNNNYFSETICKEELIIND